MLIGRVIEMIVSQILVIVSHLLDVLVHCQTTSVALSNTEVEYAAQKAAWLNQLVHEMEFEIDTPMVVYEDNRSTICLAKSQKEHPKTKHIYTQHHFVRDVS